MTLGRLAVALLVVIATAGVVFSAPALEALGGFLVVHDATASGGAAVVLGGDAMRERLRAGLTLADEAKRFDEAMTMAYQCRRANGVTE